VAAAFAIAGLAPYWFIGAVAIGMVAIYAERRWITDKSAFEKKARVRFYTVLIAAAGGFALLAASGNFASDPPEIHRLRWTSGGCLAAAWLLYFYFQYRRVGPPDWVKRLFGWVKRPFAWLIHDPESVAVGDHVARNRRALWVTAKTQARIKQHAFIAAGASALIVLLFTFVPVSAGRFLGPVWVLGVAIANIVFLGSLLIRFGTHNRLPVVRLLLAVAVVFSIWNDNHIIRTLPRKATARRPQFPAYYARWDSGTMTRESSPIVLVAASGGGLRAAYWTAASLSAIADKNPKFARQTLAISGVSGGSLGAAIFVGLLHDARGKPDSLPCAAASEVRRYTDEIAGPYVRCVHRFMRDDYLSPVLAKMTAPDLLQRFWPVSVKALDRSTALEGSWEASYHSDIGAETFSGGFLDLNGAGSDPSFPVLMLNATHVESGRRYIATSVRLDSVAHDANDIHDAIGRTLDLPLSVAAHNSARFTYVSPAGRLSSSDTLGHVVDGGYFENSGLVALQEINDHLREAGVDRPIYVLYLCNDPVACAADMRPVARTISDKTAPTAVNEVLAPIRAVLHARDARGALARDQLLYSVGKDHFLQLNVCDSVPRLLSRAATLADTGSKAFERSRSRVVSPPLGWLLSQLARDWMDASLADSSMPRDGSCRQRNVQVFARLHSLFGH
jgi:hypothetical protein